MSVALPSVAVVFGEVTVPQTEVVEVKVHLGCTNEVSSFECLIQNFDGKYGPNGQYPISLGADGSISIGRGENCPLIATVRVEELVYRLTPNEGYLVVRGRCWGEKLFRRTVSKKWEEKKGEEIVKELIDYYVGLSHSRNETELIESTDTTYSKLEYEDAKVFDIIKFIAETADKNGVIGFDFRVEPDGKFAFFPKMSKTSAIDLTDLIEVVEYRKDIHAVRNKVKVYGAAEKAKPQDKDAWTETLDIDNDSVNDWVSGTGTGQVSLDNSTKTVGNYSIRHETATSDYYGSLILYLSNNTVDCNKYPKLHFQIRKQSSFENTVHIGLHDAFGNLAHHWTSVPPDEQWHIIEIDVGEKNKDNWQTSADFDWSQINQISWECYFEGTNTGSFWIDNLFFNNCRWESTEEDSESQSNYGLRELVEIDEELHSDYECQLRAKALLEHLKNPVEHLKVKSTVIDYGNSPLLPGDKIHITLPSLSIDADYRIASAEYYVDARTQTLEVSLELGRQPQLLADYIYALKSKTAKLSKTKAYR